MSSWEKMTLEATLTCLHTLEGPPGKSTQLFILQDSGCFLNKNYILCRNPEYT